MHSEDSGQAAELFSPITLRGITVRNRVVVSPMCQYASVDGSPTDWHLVQLGRYALGGAGIVFGEETAVEPRGRKTYQCAGFWSDEQIEHYRRLTDFIRSHGATPAIQIGHSGRKASVHGATKNWAPLTDTDAELGYPPWQGLAPSAIPSAQDHPTPKAMDHSDMQFVINAFIATTQRAHAAGYEILEIHGAHGYLLHQFLSPTTNLRSDAYGGKLDNRLRFPLEVTQAVRSAWPEEKPLFYRVSAVDGQGGAWSLEDTVVFSKELKALGVDVIDCSSGGITGSSNMALVPRVPGYQVPFAERIRTECDVKTMAVGLITQAEQANTIIRTQQADLVALARELILNPNWPLHAALELGVETPYDMLPEEFAYRLQRRDDITRLNNNSTK